MNRKGFTLLEVLIALTITGIIASFAMDAVIATIKVNRNIANAPYGNAAIKPGADQRTYLPTVNACVALKGVANVYCKRTASRVVAFYKSVNCNANSMGSLTAQTNPTYDDDVTNTFWNVSGEDASLRVLVRKLNLPTN